MTDDDASDAEICKQIESGIKKLNGITGEFAESDDHGIIHIDQFELDASEISEEKQDMLKRQYEKWLGKDIPAFLPVAGDGGKMKVDVDTITMNIDDFIDIYSMSELYRSNLEDALDLLGYPASAVSDQFEKLNLHDAEARQVRLNEVKERIRTRLHHNKNTTVNC